MSDTVGVKVSGPDAGTCTAHAKAIKDILTTPHMDQKTLQLALKVYEKGVQAPTGINMNNITVTMKDSK